MTLKPPSQSRRSDLVNVVNLFHCVHSKLYVLSLFAIRVFVGHSLCEEDYFAIFWFLFD